MLACNMGTRAYSFLDTFGLAHLPNEYDLPVYLVRRKGDERYEQQPAQSIESAVCDFVRYADVKPGQTVEILPPGANAETDKPFAYPIRGNGRRAIT